MTQQTRTGPEVEFTASAAPHNVALVQAVIAELHNPHFRRDIESLLEKTARRTAVEGVPTGEALAPY